MKKNSNEQTNKQKQTLKNRKLSHTLIFCWWLWTISLLFLAGFIDYSPALTLFLALQVSIINGTVFYKRVHYSKMIAALLVEFTFIYLVFMKNMKIKRSLFHIPDLIKSIALFAVYLLYLYVNNTSFIEIYYKRIPEEHGITSFYEYYIEPYL